MPQEPKRILVAEDDEVNMMVATHILTKAGFTVTPAGDGRSAVDAAATQDFDLILMDLEMPIMDGLEAASHIRQLDTGRDVPIVALTAHTYPEKLDAIWEAGMNDYLIKPIDREKFARLAEKYLPA